MDNGLNKLFETDPNDPGFRVFYVEQRFWPCFLELLPYFKHEDAYEKMQQNLIDELQTVHERGFFDEKLAYRMLEYAIDQDFKFNLALLIKKFWNALLVKRKARLEEMKSELFICLHGIEEGKLNQAQIKTVEKYNQLVKAEEQSVIDLEKELTALENLSTEGSYVEWLKSLPDELAKKEMLKNILRKT